MKVWCILLIPRHISFLLLIVCSCHMLVLLSWTSVNNNSYNAQHAPLVPTHYRNNLLNSKIEADQFPMGIAKDYRASTRWNLSSFDDIIPPRGEIDGYIGRQQHSNLPVGYKANGVSFVNVSTAQPQASKLQLYQTLALKDLQFVTQKLPLETKGMQPLTYSDRALKEFYGKIRISAGNKNRVSNLNFQYFINPEYICKRSEDSPNGAYLSVMVHSHPANKPQRDAIRNTWGRLAKNYDTLYQMRLVFVLGIANQIEEQDLIWKESKLYHDILQGSFTDLYDNLSVKSLFAIHWISNFCNDTKYMLKTDDDTYINVSLLINWLRTINGSSHTVIGASNRNAKVMRSGLWQVPFSLFPFDKYPSYCTGCAYVLSTSILRDLLQKAEQVPLIPVEDAYITGILVKLIGHTCYNHKAFPQWYMGPSLLHICNLVKQSLYGVHNVPYYLMYSIYRNITANSLESCTHNKRNFIRKQHVS